MASEPLLMPECQVLCPHADDGTVVLSLSVAPELEHFRGHFPGFGVLPGVVQIDWAVRLARRYLPVPLRGFKGMDQIKFQALVLPAVNLSLRLQWDVARGRLTFAYHEGDKLCASGRLTWAGDA